jgi:hypothetical protein
MIPRAENEAAHAQCPGEGPLQPGAPTRAARNSMRCSGLTTGVQTFHPRPLDCAKPRGRAAQTHHGLVNPREIFMTADLPRCTGLSAPVEQQG